MQTHGHVRPGYEAVRTVFEENFRARDEVGAAVAVVVANELVVDLWGGMANPHTNLPWREDTLVNMFSTTKGISALATAHAHSRGPSFATLADPDAVAAAIAKQAPAWAPGKQHGYHGITLGWYESELIRRTDPQHRTIGRYFADEIAAPLDLDFYIGVPDEIPDDRLARIMGDWFRIKMMFNIGTTRPEPEPPWARAVEGARLAVTVSTA